MFMYNKEVKIRDSRFFWRLNNNTTSYDVTMHDMLNIRIVHFYEDFSIVKIL